MGRRKKGRSKKNNVPANEEPEELKLAPHSFVIHRGPVGNDIIELTKDFRRIMEPFTASSLKVQKKNAIKDFVSVSGLLNVSHMCIFSGTDLGVYMKIARLPQGPTLNFWVHNFSLARDVASMTKKQFVFDTLFRNSPLIVLNNFSGEGHHMKLMASMFQNMFPTINITKVNLSNIRRCVLVNYNVTSKLIDLRHYAIKPVPVGISKGVKKLVQGKVPNMGRFEEISEFITKSGQLSESEAEDDETSHVTLPQKLASRGSLASSQSALRLIEIGPRLTLQLMKIEGGLMSGEVLFHEIVEKSEEEKLLIQKRREQKRKLKEKRKKLQEQNVKRKIKEKEYSKEKSLKGMEKAPKNGIEKSEENGMEEDDDAEWYRTEVGEEPEKDLFQQKKKRKQSFEEGPAYKKRRKADQEFKNKPMQNKFGRRNEKLGAAQRNQFQRRKVLGSKISKKRKQ